jgi:NaMN:DMB phosphoribosyltransferase
LGGEREGAEWVVREGVGAGGEMNQALYAHMNNKRKMKKKKKERKLMVRCRQV